MKVKTIYINTCKFDFNFAKICIASIRFWYPDIEIKLIKDFGRGNFSTRRVQKKWHVGLLKLPRRVLGWGYGKLEPLFLENPHSFLILDSDTVMVGPVLESLKSINAKFIVDEETITFKRFNELYYNVDRITELAPGFKFPGYGFNSGQWVGTAGVLKRTDFERTLQWSYPPKPIHPEIVFEGDQAHLNFTLHMKQQFEGLSVARQRIMVWPEKQNADFLDLEKIARKSRDYPYIVHWAGMKFKKMSELPRADILEFYADLYYKKMGKVEKLCDRVTNFLIPIYKKWRIFLQHKRTK